MRAAVIKRYGPPDVVEVIDVPDPMPGKGEVLVRVLATAVTAGDARIRGARFPAGFAMFARLVFGVWRPRRPILGGVIAGRIEQVGPGVSEFAVGDTVAGMNGIGMGGHAEFVAMRARLLAAVPSNVTPQAAAGALFGGSTALHFLRDRVNPGSTLLVNGASGAVGSSAVQIARHFGGTVTGVTSTANIELVKRLGAVEVIDYTATPLATMDRRFDVVLDAVGNLRPADAKRLLTPGGTLILAAAGLWDTIRARGRVVAGPAPERREDFVCLLDLLAKEDLEPTTEMLGGLDAIREAYRRIDSGRKVGNLVVNPQVPAPQISVDTRPSEHGEPRR